MMLLAIQSQTRYPLPASSSYRHCLAGDWYSIEEVSGATAISATGVCPTNVVWE